MSSDQFITLLVALFGGAAASLVTGLLGRPKLNAEARATQAGGEVSISGDAREWAKTFATRAEHAEQRADEAEEKAEHAEARARATIAQLERVEARCDELEANYIKLSRYTAVLLDTMKHSGMNPPEPPFELPML